MIVNKQVAKTIENKSQARRVILNIDDIRLLDNYFSEDRSSDKFSLEIFIKATAKWKVGDILWVKEPARVTSFNRIFKNGVKRDTIKAKYIADGKEVINTTQKISINGKDKYRILVVDMDTEVVVNGKKIQ